MITVGFAFRVVAIIAVAFEALSVPRATPRLVYGWLGMTLWFIGSMVP